MIAAQGLTLGAVGLQSAGKVLYGTFIPGVSAAVFILASFALTAAVFLLGARLRAPRTGRRAMVMMNVWTAVTFLGFFYALQHLPPATVGALDIGASLLAGVLLVRLRRGPGLCPRRALACAGIVGGCAILAAAEMQRAAPGGEVLLAGLALFACLMVGVASALVATLSKALATQGWRPGDILAHRFYLTIAAAVLWLAAGGQDATVTPGELSVMLAIGSVAVLLPMLLLQLAIQRADAVTVLICMAAQPMLSFALSMLSPAYDWSTLTLAGVLVVTAALLLDIRARRAAPGLPAAR
ncbi:hypothetical protein ACKI2N_031305 [Cupriavidus sp. 30B13]|uniref:hypothetical protein n=1 Tax=Cupriavidus sp. 30B13 TaxID=3384241 RepID=UPI003B9128A6